MYAKEAITGLPTPIISPTEADARYLMKNQGSPQLDTAGVFHFPYIHVSTLPFGLDTTLVGSTQYQMRSKIQLDGDLYDEETTIYYDALAISDNYDDTILYSSYFIQALYEGSPDAALLLNPYGGSVTIGGAGISANLLVTGNANVYGSLDCFYGGVSADYLGSISTFYNTQMEKLMLWESGTGGSGPRPHGISSFYPFYSKLSFSSQISSDATKCIGIEDNSVPSASTIGVNLLIHAGSPANGTVSAIAINNPGSGYQVNTYVSLSGGDSNCVCLITSVDVNGAATQVQRLPGGNGSGYSTATGVTTAVYPFQSSPETGSGLTLNITAFSGTNKNGGNLTFDSGKSTGTGSSYISFRTTAAGTSGTTINTPAEKMRLTSAGALLINGLTASELVATDASKQLQSLAVATYPSLTEISYVKGVTSAIQTQLNGKANTALSNLSAVAINTHLLPGADGGVNLGSQSYRFSSFYSSSIARDSIPVFGGGVGHDNLMTSRAGFSCNSNSQLAVNGGAYASARGIRLDVVGDANNTFSETGLTGSCVLEQSSVDRNRLFLQNKTPLLGDSTGSSSSAIHWMEFYTDATDPYYVPIMRSAYEMGNDYWLGQQPTGTYGERYWDTISASYKYPDNRLSWYLWDSVHAINKLYIDNQRIESWGYSYQTTSNYRMFLLKEDYRGNLIFIGRNAGNEAGEDYGASICIGDSAGYNKSTGGSNVLIGHFAGGNSSNGTGDCFIGNYAGGSLDGGNNVAIGMYAGSQLATGYTGGANSILIGQGANNALGNGRVIIDTYGRSTAIATLRDAMIYGVSQYATPYTQTLYINANVSVQGINLIADRDSSDVLFCRVSEEAICKRQI